MLTAQPQYEDLVDFLTKHKVTDKAKIITHTRIGDKIDKNASPKPNPIYGGSYSIPESELDVFYELYYKAIFVMRKKEYLTEAQLPSGLGPMAVDLDFKYNYMDVVSRPHTDETITDVIMLYLDEMKNFFLFEEDKSFEVFAFEKPNVNRLLDGSMTKDGIHLIFGLQINHTIQLMIRESMVQKLGEVLAELPLINDMENILDEGITKGTTNWQLFGSRKPYHDAYELKQHWVIKWDQQDNMFITVEKPVEEFNMRLNFKKLSVQYTGNPSYQINPDILPKYNERSQKNKKRTTRPSTGTVMNRLIRNVPQEDESIGCIGDITTIELLEKAVSTMLSGLEPSEYEIQELHDYVHILPSKYYEPGSHLLNRQVAFALKNKDNRLFWSWMLLRSKASDFDIFDIGAKYEEWTKMRHRKDGITERSISYWAKQDAFDEYEKIKTETIDHHLEITMESKTEFDAARVLLKMFSDKYVCTSLQSKTWFAFKDHRWIEDKGLTLRKAISTNMYELYDKKRARLNSDLDSINQEAEPDRTLLLNKKVKGATELMMALKKTTDKDHIMREAMELFYSEEFVKSADCNPKLMCFKNGIIDFDRKTFRAGNPEDYITMTTGIDYIELDESNHEMMEIREEVLDLMRKLFPDPELNRYMWDHLASCLIGTSLNQTFNVYYGIGSNGKSILTDLMSRALGDYKGSVPLTLITDKRSAIGGTSSEIIQLKGVRYAVMQEPSKDTKINEGIMKELTGGDPLQGRALYNESETFTPQFNLVVCTNSQFKIESNDDGTWRRIREVAFNSKFVDDESEIPAEQNATSVQQCFLKDKNLKEKLPKLAPIFMSMLVTRAFETGGKVDDCAIVMEASRAYRLSQDKITTFVNQYFELTENPKKDFVPLTVIKNQFKTFSDNHAARFPSAEFYAHFEKQAKYKGKVYFDERKTKLCGVKIIIREHLAGVVDVDLENIVQNSEV